MRDLILLPEILPSVAVGDNTKMCLTSLILFVAAQKIIERMGNPLLKIRLARQRREERLTQVVLVPRSRG